MSITRSPVQSTAERINKDSKFMQELISEAVDLFMNGDTDIAIRIVQHVRDALLHEKLKTGESK